MWCHKMCYLEMIMYNLQEQTGYTTQTLVTYKSKTSPSPIIPILQIDVNLIGNSATANHTTTICQHKQNNKHNNNYP